MSFAVGDFYAVSAADLSADCISHLHSVDKLAVEKLPDFHSIYVTEGLAQFEFCASRIWEYIASTRNANSNTLLTDHPSIIAPPSVLSPSSILPPPSSNCAYIPSRKNLARLLKILFFQFPFFNFLKIALVWNCLTWKCLSLGVNVYAFCD